MLGRDNNPDLLPQGFFVDRQRNRRSRSTITYYLNHDIIIDGPEIKSPDGSQVLRPSLPGATDLGFRVVPRPDSGFVHYLKATLNANAAVLNEYLRPNETLLLDIVLRRVVREGTFKLGQAREPLDFANEPPGDPFDDGPKPKPKTS